MARPRNDLPNLFAGKMLDIISAQRARGGDAYPVTLQKLAELVAPLESVELARKALGRPPVAEQILIAPRKNEPLLIALVEDARQLAGDPRLLEHLLGVVCTPAKPLWPVARLRTKLDPRLRDYFDEAVGTLVREQRLPLTIGCEVKRGKPHLFLVRLPPPKRPEIELAEKLGAALEAQRRLGGSAYPLLLSRLVELTDRQAPLPLVALALKQPSLAARLLAAAKLPAKLQRVPDLPIALAEDTAPLARSPLLLRFAVQSARTDTNQAFPVASLKKKVQKKLETQFDAAVRQRLDSGELPPGVGWLWSGKKQLLFLLEDVHGAIGPPRQPASRTDPEPATPPLDFARAFDEAFDRLNRAGGGHNLVSLTELRPAMPVPREVFDLGLRELRRGGRYSLSSAEGRHGLSDADKQAGIVEDGTLLLHVSRRGREFLSNH